MDFNFISDAEFRASLTSDYAEMLACADSQSWKAVHVLAGSIVEALLIEYLVVSKISPGGKDPLTLDLSGAITACEAAGVLQKTTASLCGVIRGYRNLIHAGRLVRLREEVSPESGRIAINLVSLIRKEVEQRRKLNYGPTAEQIVTKLRTDEHCLAVLPELLSETNEHERVKLVLTIIPDSYRAEDSLFPNDDILGRLQAGYRQVLDSLPAVEQKRVAERFAEFIRNDSSERIQAYSDAFFSARDIKHLDSKDSAIVLKYLLNRLDQPSVAITEKFIEPLEYIGDCIETKDMISFADSLIKFLLRQPPGRLQLARNFVYGEYERISNIDHKTIMEDRVSKWITTSRPKPLSADAISRLGELSIQWSDIPF